MFTSIKSCSYDIVEYIAYILKKNNWTPAEYFSIEAHPKLKRIFYHSQCQQRSIQAEQPTIDLLTAAGFDVEMSDVECCGMAGSFGYKKDFYPVSMKVGEALFSQIEDAEEPKNERQASASGVSCKSQIHSGFVRPVYHPIELLEKALIEKQ